MSISTFPGSVKRASKPRRVLTFSVFDLGKHRLKSGQSVTAPVSRFVAKNLWIQLIGWSARMARELPEIRGAAGSSMELGRAKTAAIFSVPNV